MAHQIKERDVVKATESTWHGLDTREDVITRENAGNCFTVHKRPIYNLKPPVEGQEAPTIEDLSSVDGFMALVHEETNRAITVCYADYQVIQNEWLWNFAEAVLSHIPGKVTCAGTLANQQRAFVSIRLDQEWRPVDEHWLQNINICNSFDRSSAFEFYDSSTRIVCDNTLQFSRADALKSAGIVGKVIHAGDVEDGLNRLLSLVELAMTSRRRFEQVLEKMASQPVAPDEMVQILANRLAVKRSDGSLTLTPHAQTGMASIAGLFYRGKGNKGSTYYDLLNAGTEWWTHGDGAGRLQQGNANETKRFANSEFGTAAGRKVDWLNTLIHAISDDDARRAMIEYGGHLMANSSIKVDDILEEVGAPRTDTSEA